MFNKEMPDVSDLPSSRQLARSTVIAAVVAVVLLLAVVLPAEHGVDPTGIGNALGLKRMGEVKQQLAAESRADAPGPGVQPQAPPVASPAAKTDEIVIVLKPDQGAEVKLQMDEGAKVVYEWSVQGGPVNHDTHGDGAGVSHSYSRGRQVQGDQGELVAKFAGKHGWFWRNRNPQDVTITLRSSGAYTEIKRVL